MAIAKCKIVGNTLYYVLREKRNGRLRLSSYGKTAYDFIYSLLLLPSRSFMTHFCTSAFLYATSVNESTMAWSITRFIFSHFSVLPCRKFECKLQSVKTKKVLFFKCPVTNYIARCLPLWIVYLLTHFSVVYINQNHHQISAAFLHVGIQNDVHISIANTCWSCLH